MHGMLQAARGAASGTYWQAPANLTADGAHMRVLVDPRTASDVLRHLAREVGKDPARKPPASSPGSELFAKLFGGDASPSLRIGASFRQPSIEIVIIRLVIGWSCIEGSKERIGRGMEGLEEPSHGRHIIFRQLVDQSVQGFASRHTLECSTDQAKGLARWRGSTGTSSPGNVLWISEGDFLPPASAVVSIFGYHLPDLLCNSACRPAPSLTPTFSAG